MIVVAIVPVPDPVTGPVRVTPPLLDVGMEQLTLDPLTAHVQFVLPLGAAGVVPLRFGLLTDVPLTLIEPLLPLDVCGFCSSQLVPSKITSATLPFRSPAANAVWPGPLVIVTAPEPLRLRLGDVVSFGKLGVHRTSCPC